MIDYNGRMFGSAELSMLSSISTSLFMAGLESGLPYRVQLASICQIFYGRSYLPIGSGKAIPSIAASNMFVNVDIFMESNGEQSADVNVLAHSEANAVGKVTFNGKASLWMNDGMLAEKGLGPIAPGIYDTDQYNAVGSTSFILPSDRQKLAIDVLVFPNVHYAGGIHPLSSLYGSIRIR
jgi:hypothetical protein